MKETTSMKDVKKSERDDVSGKKTAENSKNLLSEDEEDLGRARDS